MKKALLKYVIECIIVAFGVFLGMYLSERREEQENHQQTQKALSNIISELEQNREGLQQAIYYHERIRKGMDSLQVTIPEEVYFEPYLKNSHFKFNRINRWKGHGFAELQETAFEVAKTSGTLQNMPIDLLQKIAGIYGKIRTLESFQATINDRMTSLGADTKTIDMIGSIKLLTGDNLFMEKQLVGQLKETIAEIKEASASSGVRN